MKEYHYPTYFSSKTGNEDKTFTTWQIVHVWKRLISFGEYDLFLPQLCQSIIICQPPFLHHNRSNKISEEQDINNISTSTFV
jgi:hypothetical protein